MKANELVVRAGVCVTCIVGLASAACSSTSGGSSVSHDAGTDRTVSSPDGASYVPGDGALCSSDVGGFPAVSCDPSDEQAQGCQGGVPTGCTISALCGDTTTCEPFISNPAPEKGVDTFRMRLVNLTSPPVLATNQLFQELVLSSAVDLPDRLDGGGAPCGENGQGYLNWLLTIDKAKGTVQTGGAPPSIDPFNVGYCYLDATIGPYSVKSITASPAFDGGTFDTAPASDPLYIPIFQAPKSGSAAVILPIRGATFHGVTVSTDGNCIGSININASIMAEGDCVDTLPFGPDTCSRWHAGGAFGCYIKLSEADGVYVWSNDESLCAALMGKKAAADSGRDLRCTEAEMETGGDYNSTTGQPCSGGSGCDSTWISLQFAASAVKISDEPGVSLCHGGSLDIDGGTVTRVGG